MEHIVPASHLSGFLVVRVGHLRVEENDHDCDVVDDFFLFLPTGVSFSHQFVGSCFRLVFDVERKNYFANLLVCQKLPQSIASNYNESIANP